ncbi:MAG: hypothetical protein AAGA60_06350 [Cyanobacteria bacterium P01_E01_bin.42]
MNNQKLASYFRLHRRYYRSVNLERDLDKSDAVQGYILTERSGATLQRILSALTRVNSHRAWTLTGSYGTGKSAFAHYLASLCRPAKSEVRQEAFKIASGSFGENSEEIEAIANLPDRGLFLAVATGRSEPLSWTIARALAEEGERFWYKKRKPDLLMKLNEWRFDAEEGNCQVSDRELLKAIQEVGKAAKTHVLLMIDELGKNLEFAAYNKGVSDLYLLQEIAELPPKGEERVYFLGLLHQSFGGYGDRLVGNEQSEWTKVQGRFEDIPFQDSSSQMTRLIGRAIDRDGASPILCAVGNFAREWYATLRDILSEKEIPALLLEETYPLHPLAALILPLLCERYAQNDRSLFTFLTSNEPYGFNEFLQETRIKQDVLPTLKLHQIYDYFIETVTGLTSRLNLQRWVEIQGLIQDARDRAPETLALLKTIGIFNLVTLTASYRATPRLVALALCDTPNEEEQKYWQDAIVDLQKKGLITYRRQLDELRIWEGSDFNVEAAIHELIEKERASLADLFSHVYPLKPLVAQRHYNVTGTLRYFERRYADSSIALETLTCSVPSHDGLILYWLDRQSLDRVPSQTVDGKPLIVIKIAQLDELRVRGREFQALEKIRQSPELQNDGVARREVKYRLVEGKRRLDETCTQSLGWLTGENRCWIAGEEVKIRREREFQGQLSALCDRIYHQGIILDNELINRRELTSQGAKARRELIEAAIERSARENLGLTGYGPEVAIYHSVLKTTEIHRQEEGEWGFYPPLEDAGVRTVWQAIEDFCLEAKDAQKSLDRLEERLAKPPFGVKQGAIPILLAAVLLYRIDDVGVYRDGTFIPVLGAEHFELLLKNPARFSVKYFEILGLRSQVFKELESIFRSPKIKIDKTIRNASLLAVAKPLFSFVNKLPKYTLSTQQLSKEARQVLKVLQVAREPDELLFVALPNACGLSAMRSKEESEEDIAAAKLYRKKLIQCLHEIQTAYDRLLSNCHKRFYEAFGIRRKEEKLRDDLASRGSVLVGRCIEPLLKQFVDAAVDEKKNDREWLERLVEIVAGKSARSWTDEDITRFELALSDLVRRFKNMEALQKDAETFQGQGFEAKRITVTESNGREVHQVVWIDEELDALLDNLVTRTLASAELQGDLKRQQAFIAKLSERVLGENMKDSQNELLKRKRGNASSIFEKDGNALQETFYLQSIPKMAASIKEGGKTTLTDCIDESTVRNILN